MEGLYDTLCILGIQSNQTIAIQLLFLKTFTLAMALLITFLFFDPTSSLKLIKQNKTKSISRLTSCMISVTSSLPPNVPITISLSL